MSALMKDEEVLALADDVLAGDFDFSMGSAPLKIAAICRMLKRCSEADQRDAVLEEAARVCDALQALDDSVESHKKPAHYEPKDCAEEIRALKARQSATESKG